MLGQAGAWQPAIRREHRCRSTVGVRVDLTWLRPGPTSRAVVTPCPAPRSYRDGPPYTGPSGPLRAGGTSSEPPTPRGPQELNGRPGCDSTTSIPGSWVFFLSVSCEEPGETSAAGSSKVSPMNV